MRMYPCSQHIVSSGLAGNRNSWGTLTVERRLSTKDLWPECRARSSSEEVNMFKFTAVTSTTHSWQYGNWNRNGQPPVVSSAARRTPTSRCWRFCQFEAVSALDDYIASLSETEGVCGRPRGQWRRRWE